MICLKFNGSIKIKVCPNGPTQRWVCLKRWKTKNKNATT